ncbi:hypothetical protein ACN4EK_14175 [Pantanalinema rosaneae CENA516]|uniref:hypothetical protein n=1 Tax=Pantanalinema rosaneae TaxID=1620701 RepID=UPI003D6F3BDC
MMATTSQTQIIFPQSSSEQGYAFEYLLLRYFQQIRGSTIEHFSTYKHGKDKKWYQIDGLLVNNKRQLLEAKFYQKPVGCREIDPDERLQAAKAFDCDELLLVSLNGFKDDVRSWASSVSLPVRFVEWNEIREDVLESFEGTFTVLLDQVLLEETVATSFSNPKSKLSFSNQLNASSIAGFPEFSVYSDSVELWLRRLRRLADWQEQLTNGQFHYQNALETVRLLPDKDSYLSLEEAWRIEEAFSGYAARTYGAVRETAQALRNLGGSAVLKAVVQEIHLSFQQDRRPDKRTGDSGVRDSLNALAFMALVQRPVQRGDGYTLTPLGWAYVRGDEPDDQIFRERLTEWLPFRYFRLAIEEYQVPLDKRSIIEWFQTQYAPYEPYARCLFNANKVDGLITWYKQLGF